ncbi:hypothetical protein [Methylobacterium sp. E-045]|uniref:hypothetical protein n=1 Tax=Methylobacterium sp. E-045 TaxID=2836575 RepID=UPI001FBB07B3|nr:hypothetical protein [Methylobacterium sp. E-045]MCJ2129504.1 hypothetical protein [Methylobacterium sp. E-045]
MRYGLFSTCSAALLGALMSTGGAGAQGRPAWVDPPAKADTKPEPKPASPQAVQGAPEASPAQAAKPETAPSAASVAERGTEAPQRTRRGSRHAEGGIRHSPRRLSQVPPNALPLTVSPGAPPPNMAMASEDRFPEWARKAQRLNEDYLDAVSEPGDGMVAAAPRFYAESVRFHGRTLSLAALMAEKRRFVRRWPDRRYVVQDGSPRTACSVGTSSCIVRSTFDFRAANPRNGARSQGVAELTLEISFAGPRPVIVSESSRVLRRFAPGQLSAAASTRRGA